MFALCRVPPHRHICQAVAMDDRSMDSMSIIFERGEGDLEDAAWGVTPMSLSVVLR